jgi:hypothetical protein
VSALPPCDGMTRFADLPGGGLEIQCPRCGFLSRFTAAEVADWFRGAKPTRCGQPRKAVRS